MKECYDISTAKGSNLLCYFTHVVAFFSAVAHSASLIFVSNTDKYVTETPKGLMIYLKQTSSSNVT